MATATLKAKINKKAGTITIPLQVYRRMLMMPPIEQLKGKAARDLDKLVEEGLREYRAGKTISADSISSAVRQRRRKHAR